jgi:EAL domain-containing protein (putative c-di-GMP-specific phosphodiesterase class I)
MRRLPGDSGAERVVALLLQLAQGLGVAALAEGIESASQLDLLERHGCAFAQGYYFSRPLPADAIASLLIAWPLAA